MDHLLDIAVLTPGCAGCLFMFAIYCAERRLARVRTEIATRMNWVPSLKRA